ncbi:zeta toxin family protein [Streptomyces sp. NPDC002004]
MLRTILPTATREAVPHEHPAVVTVAGQPGAGKTHTADLVQAALDRRDGSVRIGHPERGGHRSGDLRPTDRRLPSRALADGPPAWAYGPALRPNPYVDELVRLHVIIPRGSGCIWRGPISDPEAGRTDVATAARCPHQVSARSRSHSTSTP